MKRKNIYVIIMDKKLQLERLSYSFSNEEKELSKILDDVQKINEIQRDLAILISGQDENIDNINLQTEETVILTENANNNLEISAGRKLKFAPLIIGAGLGVIISLPLTIPLATAHIIGGSAIGWSALGTGLFGGFIGKNLS